MKTVLLTGATGFLGQHVAAISPPDWQVMGTGYQRASQCSGVLAGVDLRDRAQVEALLHQVQPDAIIHCAAIANANQCEQQPAHTEALNVATTLWLGAYCRDRQLPYLFVSTDMVFDGTQAPYTEGDRPTPINAYGRQKARAEQALHQLYPVATICRLPLLFGARQGTASCFLQSFLTTLQQGQPLTLFTDEFRTPVSASAAAQGLWLALTQAVTGWLHLGGRERLSRYEFGQLMVAAFNLPPDLLVPCRQADVPMAAPRPPDVSLDSARAWALGYDPPTIAVALQAIATAPLAPSHTISR